MFSPSLSTRLLALVLLTGLAEAQTAAPLYDTVPVQHDSGQVSNTGTRPEVVASFPVQAPGATWLRLYFDQVDLAGDVFSGDGAILRLTSWLDGDIQEMNARHVDQWQKSTAYFNGDTVQVEVLAYPGTGASRVRLRAIDAGLPAAQQSQCGPNDDRILSQDARAGRILPVGCTGWLIDDCAHCLLTAGHCTGAVSVVQFNVPLSNPNGSLNNPPASDQYAADSSSLQTNGGQGVGSDWGYFGTFPNPNTGLTAAQAQGAFFVLGTAPTSTGGNTIRITGYGTDNSPSTHNQVQQTHVGPLVNISGTQIGYRTDTTGGNSGSPVIHEQTGNAVGIHTHGGCGASGGNNWGTKSTHPALLAALADPTGICAGGGIDIEGELPSLVTPGLASTLQISMSSSPVAGTQMLHYRLSSGDLFTAIPMSDLGGGLYTADLPAAACGDSPEFYFSAQDSGCGMVTNPEGAPMNAFTAEVGVESASFQDNFELDLGWNTQVLGASAGAWERGVPVNDPIWAFDPTADGDGSGQCFLTQNTLGNSDVDGGSVRLVSPALDLAGGSKGLSYRYYLNLSAESGTDGLRVEMSSNGVLGPWMVVAEHLQDRGLAWTEVSLSAADILAAGLDLTGDMRARFTASDLGTPTTVEAGLDAVRVVEVSCSSEVGDAYCSPAELNSTGLPAVIVASGSASAADNDVLLQASNMPLNQFGFFLNSQTQGLVVGVGGGQGNLCLAGGIGRYNNPVLNSGASGAFSLQLDLTQTPTPMGPTSVVAGQTWNFQAWYRDLNPGSTSNLTDAVSILFL